MGYLESKYTGFLGLITKGHERSVKAKKNIIGTLFIKGISICISLIMVPLTLNYINPSQYGIWLTLSSMIAWISFFDIGFTQGLRNKFAEAKAHGDNQLARIYISTAYYFIGIIFILVWLILLIINQFINWHILLNIPENLEREVSRLAIIILSYFCFQFVFRIINTILIADQNPAKASLLDMLGQLISLVIIFVLTKFTSGSILKLGLAIGIAPTLVLFLANIVLFKTQYYEYRPSIKFAKKKYAKDIMSLGLKFFVLQISNIIQFQTVSFFIAHYFDTVQVTSYNIAYKYFFTLQMGFMILITPLWSGATDAYNSGDSQWIKNVVKKYLLFLLPFIVLGAIMLIFAKPVYEFWLGKNVVDIRFNISLLCYIFFSLAMFGSIFILVINGIGALKVQLITSIITTIGFVVLTLLLIKQFHFGVEAILISSIISNVYAFILAPLQYYQIFINKSKSRIWYR
jgi:O-antigen/teichoic acid export membrane protein